jgi:hypothetical protein
MNSKSPFSERLRGAFEPTESGVIGLVENLLDLSREQGLRFGWAGDQCHVRPLGPEPPETAEFPLPKSVFRAMLARLAALCNEHSPDSVSPYGGEGELPVGTNPRTLVRVAFTNTPGELGLELSPSADDRNGTIGGDAIEIVGQCPRTVGLDNPSQSSRSPAS